MTLRQFSSAISWIGCAPSAAQATRISSPPSRASTASNTVTTPSRVAMSAASPMARPGPLSTLRSASTRCRSSRPKVSTRAPWSTSSARVARPIPVVPPVRRMRLSERDEEEEVTTTPLLLIHAKGAGLRRVPPPTACPRPGLAPRMRIDASLQPGSQGRFTQEPGRQRRKRSEAGDTGDIANYPACLQQHLRDHLPPANFALLADERQAVQRVKPDRRGHQEIELPVAYRQRAQEGKAPGLGPAQQHFQPAGGEKVGKQAAEDRGHAGGYRSDHRAGRHIGGG